jgi:rare lipoprotein A (peptidoglycan hydrolase)
MRRFIARGLASVLMAITLLVAAQGSNNSGSKDTIAPPRLEPQTFQANVKRPYQVGVASWYGEDFEGRPTASGEPYEMFDMTAAHPTLPLGSWVRVTNLHNGRKVFVRINDRGPIIPGRIIDLSYSAASELRFAGKGLQRVRLDVVSPRQRKNQLQQIALLRPLAY